MAKISKTLKKSKAKKVSGKPVGKLTPEIQATLDSIREASTIDAEVASHRMAKNQAKLANTESPLTPEERINLHIENSILGTASNLKERSVEELENLNDHIRNLVTTGRDAAKAKLERERSRRESMVAESVKTVGAVDVTATQRKGFFKRVKQRFTTLGQSLSGWADIMDILSISDKSSKAFESKLSQHTDVLETESAEKALTFSLNQELVNEVMRVYGLKTDRQVNRKINQDSEVIDFGTMVDAAGNKVRVEMSKSQVRKLWMEMQEPLIKENIEAAEGGLLLGNIEIKGFTQAMQAEVFAELSAEDITFAKAQFQVYRDLYKKVNAQYRADYGVDLPFNESYSPIRRKLGKEQEIDSFLKEQGYRATISTSALKTRVRNFELVKSRSDFEAMQSHIVEMSHYITWSEKLKDLSTIFGDLRMRNAIESKFGKGTLALVDEFIEDFTNRGLRRSSQIEGVLNKLRINFTVAALALKPALALKQQASIFAYAENIPAKDFVAGYLSFWANPVKNFQTLREASSLFATRGENMERDIKDAADSSELNAFKKSGSYRDMMLFFTKKGDKFAIASGGWAVYQHTLNQGGTKADAVKAFEKATANTQQSSDISQLSSWQRGGHFAKLFTMFTSSQNQYLRREISAIRNVLADPKAFIKGEGRIGRKDFAKKIAIYHFILPMFFQWISDFGQWDEDEQKRAATLGSLNGIFILGDVLDSAVRMFLNSQADTDLPVFKEAAGQSPVFSISKDLLDALDDLSAEDIKADEVFDAVSDLMGGAVGPALGIPVKRIGSSYEGINDIIKDDDTASGALKLMGWSPYVVDKKGKEKEQKLKEFFR
jgi:hypothetical protein